MDIVIYYYGIINIWKVVAQASWSTIWKVYCQNKQVYLQVYYVTQQQQDCSINYTLFVSVPLNSL